MAQSPTNTARLRSRDYANKIRHGSPKLQEMLREKCRQRMKERRNQLFNNHRFGLELNSIHIQDTLTEIIREEIKNLKTSDWDDNNISNEIDDILTEEQALELENQIVQEQEQWMLQEYDRISQEETEYLATFDHESNDMICPTCQKAILAEESNCLSCAACGLILAGRTMQEAKRLINNCMCEHAIKCIKAPTFTVIPESNNISLYMVCYDCSTLALIC